MASCKPSFLAEFPLISTFGITSNSEEDTLSNLATGSYGLTVVDNFGCELISTFTINSSADETIEFDLTPESCFGNQDGILQIGDFLYQWTPPLGLSCFNCPNPFAKPLFNSIYNLNITDENNCMATDSIRINLLLKRMIFAPNVFSPNNDGINDFFYLLSDGGVSQILEFKVFGRWGQLVYEGYNIQPNSPTHGWDGTFKNKKMNPDVFVWMAEIEYLNGTTEVLKGDILLIE